MYDALKTLQFSNVPLKNCLSQSLHMEGAFMKDYKFLVLPEASAAMALATALSTGTESWNDYKVCLHSG